jgi:DNA-damage-inducible protein J
MVRVDIVGYTTSMSVLTRTAMLQARVTPEVKQASETVLRRLGLNMTEAMELFLRRLIVDQKLPFEVVALDDATLAAIIGSWAMHGKEKAIDVGINQSSRSRSRQKRE